MPSFSIFKDRSPKSFFAAYVCLVLSLLAFPVASNAQAFTLESGKYSGKASGSLDFSSALIDGKYTFNQATVIIEYNAANVTASRIAFQLPVSGIKPRATGQWPFEAVGLGHFNENYMETHKYPRISGLGKLVSIGAREGEFSSSLEIHGVKVQRNFKFSVLSYGTDRISIKVETVIDSAEFGIKIPNIVKKKLPRNVPVTWTATLNKQ